MRHIIQATGAEVIHLGSVVDIGESGGIQRDVRAMFMCR